MADSIVKFLNFCNEEFERFVPRSPEYQKRYKKLAEVHRKCVELLFENKHAKWEDIINEFPDGEDRKTAGKFYAYIQIDGTKNRRKRTYEPQEFVKKLCDDVNKFRQLAESIFECSESRDLIELDKSADLIRRYQGQERTYIFLFAMGKSCPREESQIFENSNGYKMLIKWGATPFLSDFWRILQQKYRITRVAIKSEAAQNLAREFSEIESSMKQQIEAQKEKILELEESIRQCQLNAEKDAIIKLARKLQNRPAPTLTQAYNLLNQLRQKSENNGSLPDDLLGVFIVLEDLFDAIKSIGIEAFPAGTGTKLTITGKSLNEYQYVKGSQFTSEEDVKNVVCIRNGWKACGVVITPAQVIEVME